MKDIQYLEYLESTGTQFIDTGIKTLLNPWRLEFKFYLNSGNTEDNTVLGQRQFGKCFNCYRGGFESVLSVGHNVEYDTPTKIIMDSSSGVWYNGTKTSSATNSSNLSSNYSALMFAFSEDSASNAKWKFHGKIYYYRIYSQNVLLYNFVPAIYKNKVGMFDTINQILYENIGTGSFLYA